MNLQQAMQPKSSANGFGRRRGERDWGTRFDSKVQSGKSNTGRSSNAGKVGVYESPSRDRLVYLATCLIGHPVEVQMKNGSMYSGTCYTTNVENEFAIILKMARLIKDVSVQGQKAENVSKAPSKTLILPGKEIVQVVAKDLSVTMDGTSNELQHTKQQEIMIDSFISQPRHVEVERELERWVPDEDVPHYPELENIFDGRWNRGWNQFETNEMLFGVKSTFNEELYTTKLERGPQMKELEREATRIAREIEGEETQDLHLAEERGIHLHGNIDLDEETRFSSVYRGREADDGGYEELDDGVMDSRNGETFGGASANSTEKFADMNNAKINDGNRVLSSSSLDEAQCSQSGSVSDLHHPGSQDLASQLASEFPSKSLSTSDNESSVQEELHQEHGGLDCTKENIVEQMLTEDAELPKNDDFKPLDGKKNESEKGRISPSTTTYTPSPHVSSRSHEKSGSPGELSDSAVSTKGARETRLVNSRGQPGSLTSKLDSAGALAASSAPGLSPSSSVSSLSSEKSTLNPHAKEFKLNPNAKSFTPSQMPARPPSPMSDGSFYYQPNVSALPNMHGLPMGMGIGPSFTGPQPVFLNSQGVPLQTSQAHFHPAVPQLGPQMLLGHPRPVFYMPSYQPEMPYKGREY